MNLKFPFKILISLKRLIRNEVKVINPTKNSNCTEFEVDKWIISEFVMNKLIPIVGFHPYPLDELMLMSSAVCRIRPTHIFEWGTHIGKSARVFYETCKHFEIDAEIHSFDLPDEVDHVEHPREKRGVFLKNIDSIRLYQEDGLKKGIEIFTQSEIAGKSAFFYLDGDHAYETVNNEVATIINYVPGAAILLHDTFYQSPESGYNIGPSLAIINTLDGNLNDYNRINTIMGLPGMTLLYKK